MDNQPRVKRKPLVALQSGRSRGDFGESPSSRSLRITRKVNRHEHRPSSTNLAPKSMMLLSYSFARRSFSRRC